MGGHQDGHPIGGEGREGGGDGLCLAASHGGLNHHEGGGFGGGDGCAIGQPSTRGGDPIGSPQGGQHGAGPQGPQGSGEGLPAPPGGQVIVCSFAMGAGNDAHPHHGASGGQQSAQAISGLWFGRLRLVAGIEQDPDFAAFEGNAGQLGQQGRAAVGAFRGAVPDTG